MENPLVRDTFPVPFGAIDAAHVTPAIDQLLAESRAAIQALEEHDEPLTWDNSMRALDDATAGLEHAMHIVGHLEGVATTDALREAYNAARPRVSELTSRIPLSQPIYDKLRRYADSDEAATLSPARRRLLDKTLAYFRRHGAELDTAGKERLAAIEVELAKKTLRYAQNVLDATNAYELVVHDEADLAGLPESARAAARQRAEDKGQEGWRFTLQAPSIIPALRHLDARGLREQLYRALSTRATAPPFDNRELLAEIVALRREKATLLGYASFADLVLEDRMAGSGERARAFIEDLQQRTRPAFEREHEELIAFAKEQGLTDELQPWDVAYYAEKLRRERCAFDEELLRPYFRFERVVDGLFRVAERLYGIRFEPFDADVWDPSVRAYRVLDGDDWRALIYADPYPRDNKHGGAWMDGFVTRGRSESDHRHAAVLVANVTPPVGGGDAELSHADVETLFHEFGHLMHHALSDAELRSQAGTHVAWDFVELPSQIMENWCWEREALDLFARHPDTDAVIPDELLAALSRTRTFRAAAAQMRQLGFAAADLAIHIDYDADRDGDLVAYAREKMLPYSPAGLPEDYAMIASFDHLFSSPVGYAAGYYSYKWAEVLDADAFTRFRDEGLFAPEVGKAFRREVLARGDEEDPAVLYRNFMGREPALDPLLARLGLLAEGA